MKTLIDPREAKRRVHSGSEIAFLDVREAGEFGEGHPLFSVPCPYSRLEPIVGALVPNKGVPLLLIDGGDGVAERAAARLQALGYGDISIVVDGAQGWAAAGFTLFKGVNVPSKTLGELAQASWHPAMIDAAALAAWREHGRRFHLFDARPPGEVAKMRVPDAVCLPNGELAHRYQAAVVDRRTPLVVTCAGRTRGIIGAIGLRLTGIENPVLALENGTQGWALAGERLERRTSPAPYPCLDEAALADSRERARTFSDERRIPWIDPADLEALRSEAGRTTYLFDVRSADEFQAGHLPGAVHAPGGQLVQAADQWVAVRRARLVLADDTGMRAALAAFWLRQMGWETYVLAGQPPAPRSDRESTAVGDASIPIAPLSAFEVAAGTEAGALRLLDLRNSQDHRAGHPPTAVWTIRPRIAAALSPGGAARGIVLIADTPEIAALAAVDLAALGHRDIYLLEGGMEAWCEAGLPIEASPARPSPEEAIDFLRFAHDRHDGNLEACREYLVWEHGLIAQLDADERAEFRLEEAAPESPEPSRRAARRQSAPAATKAPRPRAAPTDPRCRS